MAEILHTMTVSNAEEDVCILIRLLSWNCLNFIEIFPQDHITALVQVMVKWLGTDLKKG